MAFVAAVIQIKPTLGDVQLNLDRIAEAALQCSEEGADLAVFPECAVSGYLIEGASVEASLTTEELCGELEKRLNGLKRPLDIVIGYYEKTEGQPFNSALYCECAEGKVKAIHQHRKFFLPTYGVFDEARFTQPGQDIAAFTSRLGRFGILICEDVWHSVLPTLLAVNGADVLLVPAASPGRGFAGTKPENVLRYERMLKAAADEHGIFTLSSCLVGFEGGKGMSGGSLIFDPFGNILAEAPLLEENIVMAELDLRLVAAARAKAPLLTDLQSRWARVQELADETRVEH